MIVSPCSLDKPGRSSGTAFGQQRLGQHEREGRSRNCCRVRYYKTDGAVSMHRGVVLLR